MEPTEGRDSRRLALAAALGRNSGEDDDGMNIMMKAEGASANAYCICWGLSWCLAARRGHEQDARTVTLLTRARNPSEYRARRLQQRTRRSKRQDLEAHGRESFDRECGDTGFATGSIKAFVHRSRAALGCGHVRLAFVDVNTLHPTRRPRGRSDMEQRSKSEQEQLEFGEQQARRRYRICSTRY